MGNYWWWMPARRGQNMQKGHPLVGDALQTNKTQCSAVRSFFHDPFLPPTVLIALTTFDEMEAQLISTLNSSVRNRSDSSSIQAAAAVWQAVPLCSEGIAAFGALMMVSALLYQSNAHMWGWERQSDVFPPQCYVFKSKHNKTSANQKNRTVSRLSSVLTDICRQLSQKLRTNKIILPLKDH